MEVLLTDIYRSRDNLVTREIVGETLLVPISGKLANMDDMFSLNDTGAYVWGRLNGRSTLEPSARGWPSGSTSAPTRPAATSRSLSPSWSRPSSSKGWIESVACLPDPRSDTEFVLDFTRKAKATRVPLDGSIELTHRCNLRCVHCFLGDQDSIRTHRHEELTTEELEGLIDELVEAGTLNLTLSGGDPMVRKDFAEIYVYAVKRGLLVTVFCDGVLITDRIIEVFDAFPPRMVEISLYGATRETYERVTQVRRSFERCRQGIDRLHRAGHRFKLKTVLMEANRHELEAMRAVAGSLGVDFYFDTALFPCLPHRDNAGRANHARAGAPRSVEVAPPRLDRPLALRLDAEEAAAAHLSEDSAAEELAALYVRTRAYEPTEYLYNCGAGLTTFHVDPYGQLQACTISTNVDYNVRDGGFLPGWNGPLAALRELKASPDLHCRSCDKQALCSGCPAMFFAETGAGDVKSDYLCATTHALYRGLEPRIKRLMETEHEAHR